MKIMADIQNTRKFRFAITSGIESVQKLNRKRNSMDIFGEARQRGTELFRTTKNFLFFARGNGVERSTAQSIELMMIGRTLIDELFERWLMLQQPADADDAPKNKRSRLCENAERRREGDRSTIREAQGCS
jgi:hypothetical protein